MSDELNRLGVLKRREIEARVIAPLVDALAAEFGRERVLEIVRRTIAGIARQQGEELAGSCGANDLAAFAGALAAWKQDDALEMRVLASGADRLEFDVTRCRYAEMYRALGIPELGEVLSCNRDFALIEGFNPDVKLTRTGTILGGAPCCDFRFERRV